MVAWVMEESDPTPTKLHLVQSSDADDLLWEATNSDEFAIKQPKFYDLQFKGEVLRRDTKLQSLRSTLDTPFVIVKTPKLDAHECK